MVLSAIVFYEKAGQGQEIFLPKDLAASCGRFGAFRAQLVLLVPGLPVRTELTNWQGRLMEHL